MQEKIHNFADFCAALREAGFSMGGANGEGIFTLAERFGDQICWHTENAETDPWAWRIRGVTETREFAYAKVFFGKGGWITRAWYPYFLAARREGKSLEELYRLGAVKSLEKEVYQKIFERGTISLQELKSCFGPEAKVEAALNGLQMKLFITINGETRKLSKAGLPYGWPVTTFCTVERFFGEELLEQAAGITKAQAAEAIACQVKLLNPRAEQKKINKFIAAI